MQNKIFKRSFLLLMTMLLAFGNGFTAMAASSVDVVSTITQQDGTKNVVLNSTIDVEKEDFGAMMGGKSIEFSLIDAEEQKIGSAITKQIDESQVTVSGSTYSIPFSGLEFSNLKPGASYKLKASFHSEEKPLSWEQSVNILPSSYSFKIERTPKGESKSLVAVNDTIRSDDDKVMVTVLNEYGKPAANKQVSIHGHAIYTTNADGQFLLIGSADININFNNPVLFLQVDQLDKAAYSVGTVYVQDVLDERFPNYKVTELRFLDKNSSLLTENFVFGSFSNSQGHRDQFQVQGVTVYVTNGKFGDFRPAYSRNLVMMLICTA